MKKTISLKTKLTLIIMVVVLITVAIISFLANFFINKQFVKYITQQQRERTQQIVEQVSQQYIGGSADGHGHMSRMMESNSTWNMTEINSVGTASLYDGYLISLTDNSNSIVWDAQTTNSHGCKQVMSDISSRMSSSNVFKDGEFLTTSYPIYDNQDTVAILEISHYGPYFLSDNDFKFLDSLNLIIILVASVALLASVIIGSYLAKRISKPILATADVAGKMAEGNYNIRIEENDSTKEIQQLTQSFNYLAENLGKQDDLRKKLTANVAHELRTPLTTVGTHLEAMIDGVWEATPKRLESCYEELQRVCEIVGDLENLKKIDTNNLEIQKTKFDITELVDSAIASYSLEISNNNLSVSKVGDSVELVADKTRSYQVISNLLSNAIKYTPSGGKIQIATRQVGAALVLEVSDNGIGIDQEEIPFVFEQFYRTDKSRARTTGGSGIGLAVVKSIVLAHGGSVRAESERNKGSRFIVTLPLA